MSDAILDDPVVSRPGVHSLNEQLCVVSEDQIRQSLEWQFSQPPAKRFALVAAIWKDDDGFVGAVAQLPGVVSQGNSEQEVLERLIEAATGALEYYAETGETIPWAASEEVDEAMQKADRCLTFSAELHG